MLSRCCLTRFKALYRAVVCVFLICFKTYLAVSRSSTVCESGFTGGKMELGEV